MRNRAAMTLFAAVAVCVLGMGTPGFGRGGGGHSHGGGGPRVAAHGFARHAAGGHNIGRQHFVSRERRGPPGGHDQFRSAARVATAQRFAHTSFAAQRFRGFSNFSHTGFNRNSFGNERAWNGWGGRFWGAGWGNWGSGWGGWAGPVFWPFLFGDVFSFTFWPYDHYDPFWAFGPDFVFASIFAPGPFFGIDYGYGPDFYTYGGFPNIYYGPRGVRRVPKSLESREREGSALAETDAEAVQSCSGLAPAVTDLPIERIRQMVRPAPDQLSALDELSAALSKARDVVAASCPKTIPLTPLGRLDAAQQRLDAMIRAVQVVRSPVEKFYDLLNDDQRQRLVAMNVSRRTVRQPGQAVIGGGNLAMICTQPGAGFTNLPVQRIEQLVAPTAQQQDALNELKKASEDAANGLQASCPNQMPPTPSARLDAIEKRLGAMVDALKTIRSKLDVFYASLGDEQRARFNTLGPPAQSASTSRNGRGP
jgi:LTXXQ motif family protein